MLWIVCFDKLIKLINNSDNRGIYTICDAFKMVYFMGNLSEYYSTDVEDLKKIRNSIQDEKLVQQGGITRKIAVDNMLEMIRENLTLLGVKEDQEE